MTNAFSKEIIEEDDAKYTISLKEDDIKTIMGTVPVDSDNVRDFSIIHNIMGIKRLFNRKELKDPYEWNI